MFEKYTDTDPYVICEIGVNHEGSLTRAKEMIWQISEAGAHCAKFQSYKASKLASKKSPGYWDFDKERTKSQYELFKKFDIFDVDDYYILSEECEKAKIKFLTTPFDLMFVERLDSILSFYKIASADLTNIPLIRAVSQNNKPIVLSTGASTLEEINAAINEIERINKVEICLLHCVLNYPTPVENANLAQIKVLNEMFPDKTIGYSDHVVHDFLFSALNTSLHMGAKIIEKHYTFNKNLKGNDHYHAFNFDDLKKFMSQLALKRKLIGTKKKNLFNEQQAIENARRSVYYARDLPEGHVIGDNDLICKRPGTGVSPTKWDEIIGKRVRIAIKNDEPFEWDHLEK